MVCPVTVEASIRKGLPRFIITGLSGGRETGDRIRQAIQNVRQPGAFFTMMVHLGPVDLNKRGGQFDLAIAAGLLRALGAAEPGSPLDTLSFEGTIFLGELALSGTLRRVDSILPLLRGARSLGFKRVLLPAENSLEAALVPDLQIIPIAHVRELVAASGPAANTAGNEKRIRLRGVRPALESGGIRFSSRIIRALSLAAAGRHSLLFVGPPGSGKTSFARLLSALAPPPDTDECLDILTLTSVESLTRSSDLAAGQSGEIHLARPFRQPHHTVTDAALIGGGRPIAPGEITRAHQGILLLDELAEFSRSALQALREPLEEGEIFLSRGPSGTRFPARFLFVATTNPCPCGYNAFAHCYCTGVQKQRYLTRLLGPLRDRIDIECIVEETAPRVAAPEHWTEQIDLAHMAQKTRYQRTGIKFNADVNAADLDRFCSVVEAQEDPDCHGLRSRAGSFRRWDRIRRLARTVADLDGATGIRPSDLLEAFSYRCLDEVWKENP